MNICLAKQEEALQIAQIHCHEINQGFLSQLGIKFLSRLYEAMIRSNDAFVISIKNNHRVIGFVSGCTNVGRFYKYFLKKYFFQITFILLPKIFSPVVLKKVWEVLCYPTQEKEKKLPETELLTIAVLKEFHGQGIAQKIFKQFVLEIKKRGIKQFKVIVGESLPRAIKFYEKVCFEFHSNIFIHQNKSSRVYIYNIK